MSSEIEVRLIEIWLCEFVKECEQMEEAIDAHEKLKVCLTEGSDNHAGEFTSKMMAMTKEHVTARFHPHRKRLCHHHFFDMPSFDNHTSSINEAENKSLKASANGPCR